MEMKDCLWLRIEFGRNICKGSPYVVIILRATIPLYANTILYMKRNKTHWLFKWEIISKIHAEYNKIRE